MAPRTSDRNLLLGILALQMDFIDREQLVEAMNAWVINKALPLEDILQQQQVIDLSTHQLLVSLVDRHLELHGGKAEDSLRAVRSFPTITRELSTIADQDMKHSVATVGNARTEIDPHATQAFAGISLPAFDDMRFRVLRPHARGGLGEVFVAHDEELNREVALKEIQSKYADDADFRERFTREAEITGGLEHPGIVPVYGLGQYIDGRPFYAMRFIRGESLRDAIARLHTNTAKDTISSTLKNRSIEFRKLIASFIDVCNAIEYAHNRSVLHRDLKPDNIMLGKYGETLVVDWGLAKTESRSVATSKAEQATLRHRSEPTLYPRSGSNSEPTQMGSMIGTPAYMSPEQATGSLDALGPASDVFSLGATLYSILTSKPPYDSNDLHKVRECLFPPPRSICPEIPRALEAICLKAMEREQSRRYASPVELADELERWLADEPVEAYRERPIERIVRWSRRHRSLVLTAAAAILIVSMISTCAAVLIGRAWQSEAVARELAQTSKTDAVRRLKQASQAVDKWLTGGAYALEQIPGGHQVREQLLEMAAKDYESFTDEGADDFDIELERGRTLLRLGRLQKERFDVGSARESYRKAEDVFLRLATQFPDSLDVNVELANAKVTFGVLSMESGASAEADTMFDEAISQLELLRHRNSSSARLRQPLVTALLNRAELLAELGRAPESRKLLNRVISTLNDVVDSALSEEESLILVSAQDLLGRILIDQGHFEEAMASIREALRSARSLVESNPHNPSYREMRATSLIYLANAAHFLGLDEQESQAYSAAIVDYEMLTTQFPTAAVFKQGLAITHANLADRLRKSGSIEDAASHISAAQGLLGGLATTATDETHLFIRDTSAYTFDIQGHLLRDQGKHSEAIGCFLDAIKIYDEILKAESQDVPTVKYIETLALCHSHLAQARHNLGDFTAADQEFAEAKALLKSVSNTTPTIVDTLASVDWYRGISFVWREDHANAVRAFDDAKRLWQDLISEGIASPIHNYHFAELLLNCPVESIRNPRLGRQIAEELIRNSPRNPDFHRLLAVARIRLSEPVAATQSLNTATELRRDTNGEVLLWKAVLAHQSNDTEAAKSFRNEANRWMSNRSSDRWNLRIVAEEVDVLLELSPL